MTAHPDSPSAHSEENVLSRVRTYNATLDRLMRLYTNNALSVSEFFQTVTHETSQRLHVDRVSLWSLEDAGTCIHCIDLYSQSQNAHASGLRLCADQYPNYFDAMLSDRVIDASDAASDRRTREFRTSYLIPFRIVSMLDAQIRSATGPRGVVCAESVGVRRDWTPDEISFVASIAELVGFVMDREDSRVVQAELESTNRRLAEAGLKAKEANERYDLAMSAAVDGVWDWDRATGRVFFSEQNFTLLGECAAIDTGDLRWWRERLHPEDVESVLDAVERHLKVDAPFNETYRIRHADGSWRWWRSRGQAVRNRDGQPTRVVGTSSDVTSLIQTQQELERRNEELVLARVESERNALHDALTELPNRRHMDEFSTSIAHYARSGGFDVSLLHIDVDHFKEINDRFGHVAGDAILKHVAQVLREIVEEGDFIARIGGDEFVAVLLEHDQRRRSAAVADKLLSRLAAPVVFDGQPCRVSASVGVSVSKNSIVDAAQLLSNADLALYRAKQYGRGRVEFFCEELRLQATQKRQKKEEIVRSLARGDFIPYFQPQFYAETLELAGVEALARWRHPKRGLLNPVEFLEAAEEFDCAKSIDRQILQNAVGLVRAWKAQGASTPRLSVNVSGGRLADPGLIESVEALEIEKDFLSFELLESIFLDDTSAQTSQTLRRLRELGVQIEVDDFGTGHASIVGLITLRPQRLKIGRKLVMHIETSPRMLKLVQSIVEIARTLDIEVVAEGVETPMQIKMLSEAGCHILQGFGLARPMSSEEFLIRCRADNWTAPLAQAQPIDAALPASYS